MNYEEFISDVLTTTEFIYMQVFVESMNYYKHNPAYAAIFNMDSVTKRKKNYSWFRE